MKPSEKRWIDETFKESANRWNLQRIGETEIEQWIGDTEIEQWIGDSKMKEKKKGKLWDGREEIDNSKNSESAILR